MCVKLRLEQCPPLPLPNTSTMTIPTTLAHRHLHSNQLRRLLPPHFFTNHQHHNHYPAISPGSPTPNSSPRPGTMTLIINKSPLNSAGTPHCSTSKSYRAPVSAVRPRPSRICSSSCSSANQRTSFIGRKKDAPLSLFSQRLSRDLPSWSSLSAAQMISDLSSFIANTLVKYFRHSRYASFQRQLNLYGFRKNESGAFEHKFFVREMPELLTSPSLSVSCPPPLCWICVCVCAFLF